MHINFIGSDLFIGGNIHVYPAKLGYWVDKTEGMSTDTKSTVMDDFGNLVGVIEAAHQRAMYRQVLH